MLSSPFAIAIFLIVPVAPSLTVTVKLTSTVSLAFMSFSHLIFPCASTPSLSIDFKVVCAGIVSDISILFKSFSDLFVTLIVYVISSPAYTKFSPDFVFAVFTTSISVSCAFIFADASSTFTDNGFHPTKKSSDTITSSVSVLIIVDSCIFSVVVVPVPVVDVPVVAVPTVAPPVVVVACVASLALVPSAPSFCATSCSTFCAFSGLFPSFATCSLLCVPWSSFSIRPFSCCDVISAASVLPLSFKNTTVPVTAITNNTIITANAIIVFLLVNLILLAIKIPPYHNISLAFKISLFLFPFVHVINVTSLIFLSFVANMLTSFGSVTNLS